MIPKYITDGSDQLEIYTLERHYVAEFLQLLEQELFNRFGTDLPENFGYEKPWSLCSLIKSLEIDTYQLIYANGIFWGGSGGMVRDFENQKVYQAAFRVFTKTRNVHKSIIQKSFIHIYGTKYQIQRARELDCKQVILSFNEHNTRFYQITRDFFLPKVLGDSDWQSFDNMITFNGVPQWLLVKYL